jgi:L-alanine-DL-glutamate epimerase-like enolase superfamily enzyme
MPVFAALGVFWAEELTTSASHSRVQGVPLAAGEHSVDPGDQPRVLAGGVQVWQVDPGWTGLSRALRSADVAADMGVPTFPHASHLPATVILAGTCCRDKVPAVEYHLTVEPLRQQIFTDILEPSDGWLPVRAEPGITSGYRLSDDRGIPLFEDCR